VTPESSPRLTSSEAQALLEAFVFNVINDPTCRCKSHTTGPLLSAKVVQYLKSAAAALQVQFRVVVSVLQPGTEHLLPVFHDLISHVRKWQRPKDKRQPYTLEMFEALDQHVRLQCQVNSLWFLSRTAAVNDWVHLGCFTGSRGNEYCQTSTGRRQVSRVPRTPAAGIYGGQPVAFMECDFTFFDSANHCLSRAVVLAEPDCAHALHVRFRYDKSPINFSTRKFQRSGHRFLCPVLAGINILLRACLLKVGVDDPLACYRDVDDTRAILPKSGYFYLESSDVIMVMRSSIDMAYPNRAHYMHIHRSQVDCHSNRVTAAVALKLGGMADEDIAFVCVGLWSRSNIICATVTKTLVL
jgi:hypothetical protein